MGDKDNVSDILTPLILHLYPLHRVDWVVSIHSYVTMAIHK